MDVKYWRGFYKMFKENRIQVGKQYYIGWVRDSQGNVIKRPRKEIANTLTRFTGKNGFTEADGLCNTTPYIIIEC